MWIATSVVLAATSVALAIALVIARRGRARPVGSASETKSVDAMEDPTIAMIAAALDEVSTAAVVVDREGRAVLRNRAAQPYGDGRHGEALIEESVQARLAEALRGRQTAEDLRLHGPPERIVRTRGRPILGRDQITGAIALVDDLTEHRRLDVMRRDFVANVSHELKTPVGALSLLAETLEEETDPEVIRRFSGRIRHETDRLGELIEALLDLSRIEGGDREHEPVAIHSIIGAAVTMLAAQASAAEIDFDAPELDPEIVVRGDRRQLVVAVVNLIDNALKFSPAGSRVIVGARAVSDEVSIQVCDRGVGIPARDRHRIFERFYRVDRGRSSTTGGTGLGLSIVKHVVVNHGGRVEVESREGEGSTFTIVLPRLNIPTPDEET